jgi:hypothetical protein
MIQRRDGHSVYVESDAFDDRSVVRADVRGILVIGSYWHVAHGKTAAFRKLRTEKQTFTYPITRDLRFHFL